MFTEQELIEGCQGNRIEYQEAMYRQYYAYAMSICLRYAQSREVALEILNDSFMKVFGNIQKFDASRPFRPWFRRIIVNTATDHFRANRKWEEALGDDAEVRDAAIEAEYVSELNAQDILRLFNHLPEPQRVVFNLYEIEGYSHDEIARMLDIAPGTSRSNLSRAKKKLETLCNRMFDPKADESV